MRFQKTILVTDTKQLVARPPQCGQWIQLAWCDRPSRFHHVNGTNVTAFHFPRAASGFNSYCAGGKAVDAFAKFNRHARELSRAN
jgi:hypothetical protein